MSYRVVEMCKSTDTTDGHPCKIKAPFGTRCHHHSIGTRDVSNKDIDNSINISISEKNTRSSIPEKTRIKIAQMTRDHNDRDLEFEKSGRWDPAMYEEEARYISYLLMTKMIDAFVYQEMIRDSDNRRLHYEANKRSVDLFGRDDSVLKNLGLITRKDFRAWLLSNHPGKRRSNFDSERYNRVVEQASLKGWI